jgi:predicted ArsR family transcriptional regulator
MKAHGKKRQKAAREVGLSQRLRIIHLLKRSQGLPVSELSRQLGMSYMGVKQHCEALEKQSLVDTWRNPRPIGRPELLYRLTIHADRYFPSSSDGTTIELLETSRRLYGSTAPEKLLYGLFAAKTEQYLVQLQGATLEAQIQSLASLRDAEGYMAQVETEDGLEMVEYHSPIRMILDAFPVARRLEKEMIEKILGVPVLREENAVSGLYRCAFRIPSKGEDILSPPFDGIR